MTWHEHGRQQRTGHEGLATSFWSYANALIPYYESYVKGRRKNGASVSGCVLSTLLQFSMAMTMVTVQLNVHQAFRSLSWCQTLGAKLSTRLLEVMFPPIAPPGLAVSQSEITMDPLLSIGNLNWGSFSPNEGNSVELWTAKWLMRLRSTYIYIRPCSVGGEHFFEFASTTCILLPNRIRVQ